MNLLTWLTDPSHWTGDRGIAHRLGEHVGLSALSFTIAFLASVPPGVILGHLRKGQALAAAMVNVGRAVPSFAILAIAFPIALRLHLGFGFWPTFVALVLLAIPPMFTNAYTAIAGVDPAIVESARGCGMRERAVVWTVELPAGAPLIVAAMRVAATQVIATATLGAVVAWGGLGRFIVDGLALYDYPQVFGGAVLVGVLSIGTDLAFSLVERAARIRVGRQVVDSPR